MKTYILLPILSVIIFAIAESCKKDNEPSGTNLSGTSSANTTSSSPENSPATRSTVTKLASIPAFPTDDFTGVRLCYAQNALYITGPGDHQQAVYKLDLTTLNISSYLIFQGNPVPVAIDIVDGDPGYMVVGAKWIGFYTYKSGTLMEQNYGLTSFDGDCQSLKYLGVGMFIGTSYNNKIYSIENSVYNSGILKSSNDARLLNDQLESIPQTSNAMVGIGSESKHIYVFSNHALWQLPDNDSLRLIAGSPGNSGYRDGPGSSALFEDGGYVLGNSIAVDGNDNVFVADHGSGCIRKVDKSGNTTTVAGNIKYKNSDSLYTGNGDQMCFHFGAGDMILAQDGTSLYVVANDNIQSAGSHYAVYKITFQ